MAVGNKRISRFKAFLFDLDGVLIHSMPYHADAWLRAVKTIGVKVTRRNIYEWEGEPGMVTARRFLQWKHGDTSQFTDEDARRLLNLKQEYFLNLARSTPVAPRWISFLRRFANGNPALALVTGTSSAEIRQLLPAEILNSFAAIVTGDRVTHGKPHPEPYLKACEMLQIQPQEALVIENAPYGIQSAKSAKIGHILAVSSSLPPQYLTEADEILPHSTAVRRALTSYAQ